jgi:hypothetical protein
MRALYAGTVRAMARLDQLGSDVEAVTLPSAAFGSDFAGTMHLADGRSVFVKAATSKNLRDDYGVEVDVGRAMPSEVRTPLLRGSFEQDSWVMRDVSRAAGRERAWEANLRDYAYSGLICQ